MANQTGDNSGASLQVSDLPRLTDEQREALDDNYSVAPAVMSDEAIARRDAQHAAAELAKALRAEAQQIFRARCELRDSDDSERDQGLARDLDTAAELVRVLARLVEGKSVHEAFGAPGDFGYDTPIGAALDRYYREARS